MNSVPEEIDEVTRTITSLEIEKEAIKRDGDKIKESEIERELAELIANRDTLKADWRSEKEIIDNVQEKKELIEKLKFEADQAEREGDYGKVAELRYGTIIAEEKEIEILKKEIENKRSSGSLIREDVRAEDVAEIVSRWTGIPVTRMPGGEKKN